MNIIKLTFVGLIMSGMTMAAPLPDAPSASKPHNVWLSPFRDPFFYAGTLTLTSGVLADVHFVKWCEQARTCVESNPGADSYRRRSIEIAGFAAMGYGCSLMLHEHRWWRAVCPILPIAVGLAHWRDTRIYAGRARP